MIECHKYRLMSFCLSPQPLAVRDMSLRTSGLKAPGRINKPSGLPQPKSHGDTQTSGSGSSRAQSMYYPQTSGSGSSRAHSMYVTHRKCVFDLHLGNITITTIDSSSSSSEVLAADTILLQPVLSTSSFVVPIALVPVDTVRPSLLWYSSSSPRPVPYPVFVTPPTYSWCHLFKCPIRLSLAFLHLSVTFCTYILSLKTLVLSFLTCLLLVAACPSTHLHLCHFYFLHLGACHQPFQCLCTTTINVFLHSNFLSMLVSILFG